jgi:hypothetical protein
MTTLTLWLFLLCMACWLGAMVFFALIVAPIIFSRLVLPDAGKVVSGIFPRYYLFSYVVGAGALIVALYFLFYQQGNRGWWGLVSLLVAGALGITLYAGIVVRPQVDTIRTVVEQPTPDPTVKARFDKLHQLSVRLNGAVMVLNLLSLGAVAAAVTRHG